MIRRILGPLPDWASPENPLLRYELKRAQATPSPATRIFRALGLVLGLVLLVLGSWLILTNGLQQAAGDNVVEVLWRTLDWPGLILQALLSVLAFLLGGVRIGEERQRQTWDPLRVTERGAEIALRTRWVAIFVRLRGLLFVLMLLRALFIAGLLYQVTSHRGAYLDVLTANLIPETPLVLGVLLVAAAITAACLLPLMRVGFDAALGLAVATIVPNRSYVLLLQGFIILLRAALGGALLWGMTAMLSGELLLPDGLNLALAGLYSAQVDWGLLLLYLGEAGRLWVSIPFAVWLGLLLLGWVALQALLTEALLVLAAQRAERTE